MSRTSKKQCNEAASLLGAIFYGKDEWDCSGKVYVRYHGERHAFKTNRDAFNWMLHELDKKVDELACELGL